MKSKLLLPTITCVMLVGFSSVASATLYLRGEGSSLHGTYNLIYDDYFNITWYDFTNTADMWSNQNAWALGLEVSVGGEIFDDWRLPSTHGASVLDPDDLGFNVTTGEMGHLYYSDLGNTASSGLANSGDFNNLYTDYAFYWYQETEVVEAWNFRFYDGFQHYDSYTWFDFYALAVMDGDIAAPVPEPSTMLLFGAGLAGLAGCRLRRKKQ